VPCGVQKVCTRVGLPFPSLSRSNFMAPVSSTRCNSQPLAAPSNSTRCNVQQLAAPDNEVKFSATANSMRCNSQPVCQACCPICLSHLAPLVWEEGQEWCKMSMV